MIRVLYFLTAANIIGTVVCLCYGEWLVAALNLSVAILNGMYIESLAENEQ